MFLLIMLIIDKLQHYNEDYIVEFIYVSENDHVITTCDECLDYLDKLL